MIIDLKMAIPNLRPYHREHTWFHLISEAKQGQAWLVLEREPSLIANSEDVGLLQLSEWEIQVEGMFPKNFQLGTWNFWLPTNSGARYKPQHT